MRRSKVDVVRAQAVVDAVRSGAMSYRVASEAYSISVSSIAKRLKGKVRMDASVGAGTVLTLEEEKSLEDALIWAAHGTVAWARKEEKTSENRQRRREAEEAHKVEVASRVIIASLRCFRAALIRRTQELPKRRRV